MCRAEAQVLLVSGLIHLRRSDLEFGVTFVFHSFDGGLSYPTSRGRSILLLDQYNVLFLIRLQLQSFAVH